MTYAVLLRGINVGGKNKVPMADLRSFLTLAGFENVSTYIQSGNIVLGSDLVAADVQEIIEDSLPKAFSLDSELIRALVLSGEELAEIVADAPKGFGTEPQLFHYDVAFYMGVTADDVMQYVRVNPDVDQVTAGDSALYFARVSALRSKSRMSSIAGTPVYKSLTIRNWRTTTALLGMMEA